MNEKKHISKETDESHKYLNRFLVETIHNFDLKLVKKQVSNLYLTKSFYAY